MLESDSGVSEVEKLCLHALKTLLASAGPTSDIVMAVIRAFTVISYRRAVILRCRSPKKVIDHEVRPFCTLSESFSSIALVSRDETLSEASTNLNSVLVDDFQFLLRFKEHLRFAQIPLWVRERPACSCQKSWVVLSIMMYAKCVTCRSVYSYYSGSAFCR